MKKYFICALMLAVTFMVTSCGNNGNNVDALLDSYEELADEYTSYLEEHPGGDISSMPEVTKLLGKAKDLSDKLEKVKNEMTSEQRERLAKIIKKMAGNAQDDSLSDMSSDELSFGNDDEEEKNLDELSSSEDNDDSESNSGSTDWDELLDSYEQYVDKYISYAKKASKGDMSALSEYPAMMKKAQDFSEKLKDAQSELSSSQLARYNKISMKMLEAAQELNN